MDKLTKEQAAIIGAFTGVTCGPFKDIHEYVERKIGRPIMTHEFADKKFTADIKNTVREDFISIFSE